MYLLVALFLSQWLRSIERDGTAGLTTDEARIVSLLRDLLFEADPDADAHEPMSALLLTVWADQFDGVNVWGSMSPSSLPSLTNAMHSCLNSRLFLCFGLFWVIGLLGVDGSHAEFGQDFQSCRGCD
jgi:hypothetical protein